MRALIWILAAITSVALLMSATMIRDPWQNVKGPICWQQSGTELCVNGGSGSLKLRRNGVADAPLYGSGATLTGLTGNDAAYVCADGNGALFRSIDPCVAQPPEDDDDDDDSKGKGKGKGK